MLFAVGYVPSSRDDERVDGVGAGVCDALGAGVGDALGDALVTG
jgi:hypothetical protein